jgi:hypothetical protein
MIGCDAEKEVSAKPCKRSIEIREGNQSLGGYGPAPADARYGSLAVLENDSISGAQYSAILGESLESESCRRVRAPWIT